MPTTREIKKRIDSVKNTKKITRTMEMVATAKSKKATDRLHYSIDFLKKIENLVFSIINSENFDSDHLYLRKESKVNKVAVLVMTADRGLCGGYNSNVVKVAKDYLSDLRSSCVPYDLFVIGKKGISSFLFLKECITESFTGIDEKITYQRVESIASKIISLFEKRKVDSVKIISNIYLSSSSQVPKITDMLPLSIESEQDNFTSNYLFEPDVQEIYDDVIKFYLKTMIFNLILHSNCCEQISRRLAMKSATDSANDMIKTLTRKYNRIRQAKITQEISEIVAGADSIN